MATKRNSLLKCKSWKANALLAFMLSLWCSPTVSAYDFESNGIYYNLNDNRNNVSVTSGDAKYSGEILIPSTVSNEGVTYSVTGIEDGAFADCTKLNKVVIPSSVTSIGRECFAGCLSLMSVTCMTKDVIKLKSGTEQKEVFAQLPHGAQLYVQAPLIANYKSAEGWKNFTAILPIEGCDSDKATNTEKEESQKAINETTTDEPVLSTVDEGPKFRGGKTYKLMRFISENLRYPERALKLGLQGNVLINFTVEADGTIKYIRVLRSVDRILDEEAIRVVKLTSGKWTPAKKDGKNVRGTFTLPINFILPSRNF